MTRVHEERDGVLSGCQPLQVTQWTHEPQPVTQLSHVTYVTQEPHKNLSHNCHMSPTYMSHRNHNLSQNCHVSSRSDTGTTTCHRTVMCHLQVTQEPQPVIELSHVINVTQNHNMSQNCHVSSTCDIGITTCHRTVMCHQQVTQEPVIELSHVRCNNYDIIT